MNKVVLLFLFSLIGWISCYTPAEQAADRFWASLEKHLKLYDQDIFDPDFHIAMPDIRFSYKKSVEILWQPSKNPSNTKSEGTVTSSFTNDGLLKIRCTNMRNTPNVYILAKPNKNIEGGYKLLRFVIE